MLRPVKWAGTGFRHPRDLRGWTEVADDPRMPARIEGVRDAGPWREAGRPAHGLYEREHASGMVDWAAAAHGWMLWRWRGPRMEWCSPLVSSWNPILAQNLVLDEVREYADWGADEEARIADLISQGRKAGGYFGLRPRPRMYEWLEWARGQNLAVDFHRERCFAYVAQAGTFRDHYDLAALAAEYVRVLPGRAGDEAAAALMEHADVAMLEVLHQLDTLPAPICGLALGYPPEVTAGGLATSEHDAVHPPDGAEGGAYCVWCARGLRWRRALRAAREEFAWWQEGRSEAPAG